MSNFVKKGTSGTRLLVFHGLLDGFEAKQTPKKLTWTLIIWPGLTSSGMVIVYVSSPVRPRVLASCPSTNCRGIMPMPTRLERWMRSNDSAMTAATETR